ncbi:MAG: hypothetical protein OHK006_23440 [Thermodesulfovibrionales bacterium]
MLGPARARRLRAIVARLPGAEQEARPVKMIEPPRDKKDNAYLGPCARVRADYEPLAVVSARKDLPAKIVYE